LLSNYAEAPSGQAEGTAVREAVLKTCRHVDEFNKYGFGLPGLEELIKSDTDARNVEGEFKQEVAAAYERTERRAAAEESADRAGVAAMLGYLKSVEAQGTESALERQHILMETLFVLGLYEWYAGLVQFADENCGPLKDSRQLMICMMQDRRKYVVASSLFGDVHRFVLLRTVLAMNAIARDRMRFQSGTPSERSIWPDAEKLKAEGLVALHEMWRAGDLQRYSLLKVLMDTPVKFSYTACFTGWFLEIDRRRGTPQLFVMQFEPLEMAIGRLKSFD
jgi:hypothetical protein